MNKNNTYNILLILGMVLLPFRHSSLCSQPICEGSTGENIFTDGDFGSGMDNIVLNDPGIAPGFQYTTVMPPNDGFYTITNNTGDWRDIYQSWLRIPDNSNDPEGYMMVVNSTFTPGIFFIEDIDNLCGNTTYVFSADIINVTRMSQANHILPNVTFLIDGVASFSTGNIDQDQIWHTYGFIFTTDPGQSSVQLSLRNNAPGGFGNDLALDNISFEACGPQLSITVEPEATLCEDTDHLTLNTNFNDFPDAAFVLWQVSADNGVTWQDISGASQEEFLVDDLTNGFYLYRYLFAQTEVNLTNEKCRLISDEIEVEIIPTFTFIYDTICDGLTSVVGTSIYTELGVYVDTLMNRLGCDSIVTLDLSLVDSNLDAILSLADPLCPGDQNGLINIENVLNAAAPLTILVSNEIVEELDFPLMVGEGEYIVDVTDRFGCTDRDVILISDPPPFTVEGLSDLEIDLGETILLDPTSSFSIDSVEWTNQPDFSCVNCLQPSLMPVNNTSYSGTFWNENNCRFDVDFEIIVEKIRPIYIPNSFTPNADGTNDGFTIHGDSDLISGAITMQIYNRWGTLVFTTDGIRLNDDSTGWLGRFNDQDQPEGVYIYTCSIPFIDGEVIDYQGDLTLLR